MWIHRRNATGADRRIAFSCGALGVGLALLVLAAIPAHAQVATEFNLVSISGASQPLFVAVGPDGNLWFTEFSGNRIGRITPQGVVTEFSAGIGPGAGPNAITAGPDGNLWFTENLVDRIGRITPAGGRRPRRGTCLRRETSLHRGTRRRDRSRHRRDIRHRRRGSFRRRRRGN